MTTPSHVTPCRGAELVLCLQCRRLDAHRERPGAVPMKPQTGTRGRCIDYVPQRPGADG